jgi:hypothetical protein
MVMIMMMVLMMMMMIIMMVIIMMMIIVMMMLMIMMVVMMMVIMMIMMTIMMIMMVVMIMVIMMMLIMIMMVMIMMFIQYYSERGVTKLLLHQKNTDQPIKKLTYKIIKRYRYETAQQSNNRNFTPYNLNTYIYPPRSWASTGQT